MTNNEIKQTIKCLNLMCADLNDMHNNFDIDTFTEKRYIQEVINAVNDFNKCQDVWIAKFIKTKEGWCMLYE